MLKNITFSILTLCILLVVSLPSEAHVLETNNSVGAVLHIAPDDNPVAEVPSEIFFEFKDTQNKFTPSSCICTVKVLQKDKELYTEQLFQKTSDPTLEDAFIIYSFPDEGEYSLLVQGEALDESFSPFELKYTVHVRKVQSLHTPVNEEQPKQTINIPVIIFGLLLIGSGVVFTFLRHKNK